MHISYNLSNHISFFLWTVFLRSSQPTKIPPLLDEQTILCRCSNQAQPLDQLIYSGSQYLFVCHGLQPSHMHISYNLSNHISFFLRTVFLRSSQATKVGASRDVPRDISRPSGNLLVVGMYNPIHSSSWQPTNTVQCCQEVLSSWKCLSLCRIQLQAKNQGQGTLGGFWFLTDIVMAGEERGFPEFLFSSQPS